MNREIGAPAALTWELGAMGRREGKDTIAARRRRMPFVAKNRHDDPFRRRMSARSSPDVGMPSWLAGDLATFARGKVMLRALPSFGYSPFASFAARSVDCRMRDHLAAGAQRRNVQNCHREAVHD